LTSYAVIVLMWACRS